MPKPLVEQLKDCQIAQEPQKCEDDNFIEELGILQNDNFNDVDEDDNSTSTLIYVTKKKIGAVTSMPRKRIITSRDIW